MQNCLPTLAKWSSPVALYPNGPWLQDPRLYTDYVQLVQGVVQCPDLLMMPLQGSLERLHQWKEIGRLQSFDSFEYMQLKNQSFCSKVNWRTTNVWGLELFAAETIGYRNSYQDRQVLFILPIDATERKVFVSVLLDGHGPEQGGERVAEMLASEKGAQWLAVALKEWSQRLDKNWKEMSSAEKENGFHFVMLELQAAIRRGIVDNMHASLLASQAKTLASELKQTLQGLSYQEIKGEYRFEKECSFLERLAQELILLESLEGIGSTAIYTFWMVDEEEDAIDLWVVSVGDSWAGCIQTQGEPSFSLVQEALPQKDPFFTEVERRGGKVERDEYGTWRLNGIYSLCRGLGDLYLVRHWAELKACVQIKGMSPRPTVSHLRFCENPEKTHELAYPNLGLWVQHCDGLKEGGTLTSDQLTSFLRAQLLHPLDLETVCSRLLQRAVQGGSQDNCTIQLIDLRPLAGRAFRKKMYQKAYQTTCFIE